MSIREDGWYWIRIRKTWVVKQWCVFGNEFCKEGAWVDCPYNVDEVDERRIIRGG